jgi:hypothetical protein
MLTQAVPAAVQLYRERAATKLQMDRARQGLPPLPVEMYSPPIRVQGGIDRQTLLIGAGAAAALALGVVMFLRPRGRRRA